MNTIRVSSALENVSRDAMTGTKVSEGEVLAATPAAFAGGVATTAVLTGGATIGEATD